MDRNGIVVHLSVLLMMVALRKESVDRNNGRLRAVQNAQMSLSARRAWIEIVYLYNFKMFACMSLSARRAWIEILNGETLSALACSSLSARRAWIEILYQLYDTYAKVVALRKESVDRNAGKAPYMENAVGRSPQGERG